MELFKYIVRFFYRIRWWIIIVPILVGIFVWIITRNTEKNYDVKTTIYTGIISGYNVDQTEGLFDRVFLPKVRDDRICKNVRNEFLKSIKRKSKCQIKHQIIINE